MEFDLKQALLHLGEQNAKLLMQTVVKPLAQKYISESENKIDDILLPFLDMLEAEVLKIADKIDGVEGNI